MMRGDFVTIAMPGDFGKPRPALVIQSNQFSEHASVTVLPVTSALPGCVPGYCKMKIRNFVSGSA